MDEIIQTAMIEAAILPVAVTVAVAGIIRFGLGPVRGPAMAAAAITIAFLAAYALILTWPEFPPRGSVQKLAYIALFGLMTGALIDYAGRPKFIEILTLFAAPAAIVSWLGWSRAQTPDLDFGLTAAALWIAGTFVLTRLYAARDADGGAPVMLLAAAAGASAIAFFGAAASLAQLLGVVAAAAGGFLLWNWPVGRFPFGAAAILGAGGAFVSILATLVLFSDADRRALAVLLLVFLAPIVSRRLPFGRRRGAGPVVLGLVCLAPVAGALALSVPGGLMKSITFVAELLEIF